MYGHSNQRTTCRLSSAVDPRHSQSTTKISAIRRLAGKSVVNFTRASNLSIPYGSSSLLSLPFVKRIGPGARYRMTVHEAPSQNVQHAASFDLAIHSPGVMCDNTHCTCTHIPLQRKIYCSGLALLGRRCQRLRLIITIIIFIHFIIPLFTLPFFTHVLVFFFFLLVLGFGVLLSFFFFFLLLLKLFSLSLLCGFTLHGAHELNSKQFMHTIIRVTSIMGQVDVLSIGDVLLVHLHRSRD